MKITPRQLLLAAALACFGGVTVVALAQTNSTPTPDQSGTPTASTAAVSTTSASTSAPSSQPEAAQPAAAVAAPAEASTTGSTSQSTAALPEKVATPSTAAQTAPATNAPATAAPDTSTATSSLRHIDEATPEAAPAAPVSPAAPVAPAPQHAPRVRHGDNARVMIFNNAELGKDETADAVVAILGNATSAGTVADSVVAVCGNVHVTGPVGNSVVAVCGNVYVDSKVREVVAVAGNIELGPHAEVMGDLVPVAGLVKRDPGAIVHGQMPQVGIGPGPLAFFETARIYVTECLVKLRPLAFAPGLGWAWATALGFLVFYVVLALLFRGGMDKCVSTFETRPGASIVAAILTLLLTPVLTLLLVITVVGIAVLPFLGIALLIASLFGKATMLAWLGRRITRLFGDGPMNHPAFGVLIGGLIVLLLYTVPVLGFILYKGFGVLGLGIVVLAVTQSSKREKRPAVVAPVSAPVGGVSGVAFAAAPAMGTSGGATAVAEEVVAPPAPLATPASALPRAGFWIRTGALAIDVILGAVVIGLCSDVLRALHVHNFPGFLLLVLAAYGAVMWKVKGTTIGGIVCGLKVVRVDNRPIDWATAIVRALACFVSLIVAGLGFIWTAIDEDKQSWHDKIAGTAVVCSRGNISLV